LSGGLSTAQKSKAVFSLRVKTTREKSCNFCTKTFSTSGLALPVSPEAFETSVVADALSVEVVTSGEVDAEVLAISLFSCRLKIDQLGVNFINIIRKPFLYESALHSFSLFTVWLCNFQAQE